MEDSEKIEKIEVKSVLGPEAVPKSEHLTELRIEAIKRNLKHGDRLSRKDKKKMARRIRRTSGIPKRSLGTPRRNATSRVTKLI